MNNQSVKQQIVETLRDVENVLVTVNSNPTVDELSAALGFTLLLNKMEKHATAVFSGAIPDAISFLDPGKTFENTVDSLRDFIIALDKEKADHLRYKVDGDMVKIFITPYRTTITQQDLDFSQGDYNVEAVIAIGVQNIDDFDKALADHGRIMHDATVTAISIGDLDSQFGTINWHEADASSYSELLVELSDALRSDKNLLDEQIATAYLTGVVAATERFSNTHTTSKAMTIAAQLMAAGANQQLIATRLEQAEEAPQKSEKLSENTTKKVTRTKQQSANVKATEQEKQESVVDRPAADGTMTISHEKEGTLDEVSSQVAEERQEAATQEAEHELKTVELPKKAEEASGSAERELAEHLAAAPVSSTPILDDLKKVSTAPSAIQEPIDEPSFGGTLNATTEEAAEESRRAEEDDKNHTILTHNSSKYVGAPPADLPAVNSFNQTDNRNGEPPMVDTFGGGAPTSHVAEIEPPVQPAAPTTGLSAGMVLPQVAPVLPPPAPVSQTLADIDASNRTSHEDARAAIDAALQESPQPAAVPSFDDMMAQTPAPLAPIADPAASSSTLPPVAPPSMPPLPDFSTLPPLPPLPGATDDTTLPQQSADQTLQSLLPPLPAQPVAPPAPTPQSDDPGQFRIPGQP